MKTKNAMIASIALAGVLFAIPMQAEVTALALNAKTTAEHANVAKQYRLQSDEFNIRAAEHEKNVKELTRGAGAGIVKWPGLASRELQTERAKAVEARRAARESLALADKHIRLAVEVLAGE